MTIRSAPVAFFEPRLAGSPSVNRIGIVRPEACVTMFHPGLTIEPYTVLHIDNRPKVPQMHRAWIKAEWDAVNALGPNDPVPPHLPAAFRDNPQVRALVQSGLDDGSFVDTTRIARWCGIANVAGGLGIGGVPPLQFVHVFAERDIEAVMAQVVERGARPAGIFFSGSPKMLSAQSDAVVSQSYELVRYGLAEHIPMMGLCFGFQIMADVCFGALVQYMEVPADAMSHVTDYPRATLRVTGGARYGVYGIEKLRATGVSNPLLDPREEATVVQAHSQALAYPHPRIPDEAVLAISERHFYSATSVVTPQRTIEALRFGRNAFGAEGHPEMSPDLFAVFAQLHAFRSGLGERHDLAYLEKQLAAYRSVHEGPIAESFWRGERIGYRFVRNVLLPDYLRQLG